MQRRNFIKSGALSALAVSAYGFVRFDGTSYVGDCETTTDILGPFYRPDSPLRSDLAIYEEKSNLVELFGIIKHKDCVTPYKKAKIELWHCNEKGIYDNSSAEFRYRGTTYSDEKGKYSFRTILPVPYDTGEGYVRPAHFHLMITAPGYQPLVTQLYFSGDKNISRDPYASSAKAKSRILNVQKSGNGVNRVHFDVSLSEILKLESATLDRLVGVYTEISKKEKRIELFKSQNTLWMKNEAFGNRFEYIGNNTFEEANNPPGYYWKLQFELLQADSIRLTEEYIDLNMAKQTTVYLRGNKA